MIIICVASALTWSASCCQQVCSYNVGNDTFDVRIDLTEKLLFSSLKLKNMFFNR
jgi:hypothetical protein